MSDKDLSCVDLVRAVIKIHELCSIRTTKGCKNCIFFESGGCHFCKINYPYAWNTNSLNKWLKKHESEETKNE